MLFYLTLIRGLTGTLVHHDIRQDGVERHDRETTPMHGTSDRQGHDMELSLLMSTGSRVKEKKDPMILEDFFYFSFSSFPSTVTRTLP